MMISDPFEIKIALLGYVSVGKTTVLNALLRDKYGEVSMRRTTAGINYFRLMARRTQKRSSDDMSSEEPAKPDEASSDQKVVSESDGSSSPEPMDWSMVGDKVSTAESTLKEITADNAKLRQSNALKEKKFEVEVEEDLVEMRNDTKLVIVDIPGINEAGARTKYKDYVAKNWHNFDCVVVVMDAKQGVNTEDQVELLKFVKVNNRDKKQVPIIILGNKVDEPDDYEQGVLVSEVRSAVERIFRTTCRKAALEKVLNESNDNARRDLYPAFIPISAIHAYIYQTGSLMDFEKFKGFDNDLIEKLGREVVGSRKWKRYSREDKYKEVFEIIADPTCYQQGIEDSNFNKFLSVLAHCLGGEETQHKLIEKQLEVARSLLSKSGGDGVSIAGQLKSISQKGKVLGEPSEPLKKTFWSVYKKLKSSTLGKNKCPASVEVLANPMKQLIEYHAWAGKMGWKGEQASVETEMKWLVKNQMRSIFDNASSWLSKKEMFKIIDNGDGSPKEIGWEDLSHVDWTNILESLLLLSYDRYFCEIFGREKIFIENLKAEIAAKKAEIAAKVVSWTVQEEMGRHICCGRDMQVYNSYGTNVTHRCSSCGKFKLASLIKVLSGTVCPNCKRSYAGQFKLDPDGVCHQHCGQTFVLAKKEEPLPTVSDMLKYQNGNFTPKEGGDAKKYINITVPESIKDPSHFGHLAYKYCRFMATIKKDDDDDDYE